MKPSRNGDHARLAAALLAGLCLSAPPARAGIPELFYEGSAYPGCSARALGMGLSKRLDLSPLGTLSNPALLAEMPDGLTLTAAGGANLDIERRSVKVYDSFGSVMGESETAYNQGVDLLPSGLALTVSGVDWLPSSLALGVGWRVPSSFRYDYSRTIRDDSYVETAEEILESSGMLNEVSACVGFGPSRIFAFGLGAGYCLGERSLSWEERYVDPTTDDVLLEDTHEITGMIVRGSLLCRPVDRLTLVAGAEQPMGFEHSGDLTPGGSLELPLRLFAGGVYVPGNRLRTVFACGFHWSGDSDAAYAGIDLGLEDSWGLNVGVEHRLQAGPAVRFGFGYERSPISNALDAMSFSTGMGFDLSRSFRVDLGLVFSPRRWRKGSVPDLAPYAGDSSPFPSPSFVEGDSLTVEESNTLVLLSLTRTFEF